MVKKRGETPYNVTLSSKRENILVLPTANADGRVLPLLIIYAGKNCKVLHEGIKIYLALCSVSNLGWIACEAFFSWFEQFCIVVKERHLLLIYGHKKQLSIEVIKKAIEEKIKLAQLPTHCTDLLQPLDKCCSGPLKRMWKGKLNTWASFSASRKPVSKDAFAIILCEIWKEKS